MTEDLHELRQLIARLHLMSHVASVNLDGGSPSSEDKGGRRPPGGIDRRDDAADGYMLKSAQFFERRLAGARSDRAVALILADARLALEAWTKTPLPALSLHPPMDHPQWKRWIACSSLPDPELARLYGVSRAYIRQVRIQYDEREMA